MSLINIFSQTRKKVVHEKISFLDWPGINLVLFIVYLLNIFLISFFSLLLPQETCQYPKSLQSTRWCPFNPSPKTVEYVQHLNNVRQIRSTLVPQI